MASLPIVTISDADYASCSYPPTQLPGVENEQPAASSRSISVSVHQTRTTTPQNMLLLASGPSSAVHIAAHAVTEPSRRVRSNWLRWLSSNWTRISRASRFLLISSLIMMLLQFAGTITVLIVSRGQYCEKPLRPFLILYILRVVFSSPLVVFQHLHPRSRRSQDGQPGENGNDDGDMRTRWVERSKRALDFVAIFLFILGNYLLFTASTCQQTSPSMFYLTLTWVVFGYIIVTIPALLCLSVIGCLPCVLVAMRVLRVGEALGPTGASDNVISKIPIYRFKASALPAVGASETIGESGNVSIAQEQSGMKISAPSVDSVPQLTSQSQLPRKKTHLPFYFVRRPGAGASAAVASAAEPPTLEILDPDDAICSICLSSYADGEDLRKLFCNHVFHQECVDAWLKLNALCPLCKTNIMEEKK